MQALNEHTEISALGEVFHNKEDRRLAINGTVWRSGQDSWAFVRDNIFENPGIGKPVRGFKLFYFHAQGDAVSGRIWRELRNRDDVRLILLHRRNLLAGFVSEYRARMTGQWHPSVRDEGGAYFNPVELELPIGKMTDYIGKTRMRQRDGETMCENRSHLKVYYEELEQDHEDVLGRCVQYLGYESFSPRNKFIGTSARCGRTTILNRSEVHSALYATGDDWMLDQFY